MTSISTENIFDLISHTTRTGIECLLCESGLHNWINDWDEAAGDAKCFACGKKSGMPWVYIPFYDSSVAIWKIVMNIYPEIRKEKIVRERKDEDDFTEMLERRTFQELEIMSPLSQIMLELKADLEKEKEEGLR